MSATLRDRWTAAAALGSLGLGGLAYLAWRDRALLLFSWADHVGLGTAVHHVRALGRSSAHALPEWLVYSLPDALWQFAFAVVVWRIWRDRRGLEAACFCAIPVVLGLGSELGQLARLVPGTFDLVDLSLSALALFAALFTVHSVPYSRSPSACRS